MNQAEPARVLSKTGDQLTLTGALAGGAPAAGAAVTIDTQKNLEEIVGYWQGLGIPKIFVMGHHYINFPTSGDTTSTQHSTSQTLRGLQAAAAVAKGVPYVDLYEFMRQRIIAGKDTQGDLGWHVAAGDQHLNAYGQSILGLALSAAIAAS